MKGKEITAALLLVTLLGLSLVNAHLIEKKTSEMSEMVTRSEALYFEDNPDEAAQLLIDTMEGWHEMERYTHIMLRHSEIELVIDGFYELLGQLESPDGATHMDYERLRVILSGIADAEQVRWGSIL